VEEQNEFDLSNQVPCHIPDIATFQFYISMENPVQWLDTPQHM